MGSAETRRSSMIMPIEAVCDSSSGVSPVTTTDSARSPTASVKSSGMRSLTRSSMPSRTDFLNPVSSTSTRYTPGSR